MALRGARRLQLRARHELVTEGTSPVASCLDKAMARGRERLLEGRFGWTLGDGRALSRPRSGERRVDECLSGAAAHKRSRAVPDIS
eukprot:955360-Pyramimonas_sp.AAC.1